MLSTLLILILTSYAIADSDSFKISCDTKKNILNFIHPTSGSSDFSKPTESGICDQCKTDTTSPDLKYLNDFLPPTKSKKKLNISYPYSGPNRQIASSNYDTAAIKKIIEMAIANDLDPYLQVALTLIESPPLAQGAGSVGGYEAGYGDLPIDGLPIFDMLNCVSKKSKPLIYATQADAEKILPLYKQRDGIADQLKSQLKPIENFRNFLIQHYKGGDGPHITRAIKTLHQNYPNGCPIKDADPSVSARYCADPELRRLTNLYKNFEQSQRSIDDYYEKADLTASQKIELRTRFDKNVAFAVIPNKPVPEFRLPGDGNKTVYLCTSQRAYKHGQPANMSESMKLSDDSCCAKVSGYSEGSNINKEFMNFMATRFIKEKINTTAGELQSLSGDIQKFNGTGIIGSTEGIGNTCLEGIHMGSRPYYGARVADLMLNSILANKEINALIESTGKKMKLPVPSFICQKLGVGQHNVRLDQFFNQQKEFLLNGQQRALTIGTAPTNYKTKLTNGKVGVPVTQQDLQSFLKSEASRQKNCAKFFN